MQLLACVDPAVLTSEPLAVHQMRACKMCGGRAPTESIDRLAEELLGVGSVRHERERACLDPECPLRVADLCLCHQSLAGCHREVASAAARRGLDELRQDPAREDVLALTRISQCDERVLVTTEAVPQHGCCVLGVYELSTVAPGERVLPADFDQCGGFCLGTAPGGEYQSGVRDAHVSGRSRDRIRLLHEVGGGHKVPGLHVQGADVVERDGQVGQRSGVSREPDMAGRERVHRFGIPQRRGGVACEPAPANLVRAAERLHCSPQRRGGARVAVGEQHGQSVEQEVGRVRRC